MDKKSVVHSILGSRTQNAVNTQGTFFAPSNIALCKYWGKRNMELNLPYTSSLSISLGHFGAKTTLSLHDGDQDQAWINGKAVEPSSVFVQNLSHFLDLFRENPFQFFKVQTEVNIPIGAGLASSACGFAALVGALDALFGWQLSATQLSLLARLGSGSASRSFWTGFVEWYRGEQETGMDSVGIPLEDQWPDLRIGLLILNREEKAISSRAAMQNTVLTSPFYNGWLEIHAQHFGRLKKAISVQNFTELGEVSEANALAMHALLLTNTPPVLYSEAKTTERIHTIWRCRRDGLPLYFTQDAGPNLKLLFLKDYTTDVLNVFPELTVISPFEGGLSSECLT